MGLALEIMPGDLGVYAAESLSAASAPESAYTALGEMSRQRAGQWREQHGFLSDADLPELRGRDGTSWHPGGGRVGRGTVQ